jgi:hypothetical protein
MSYLVVIVLIPVALLVGSAFDAGTRTRIGNALSDGAGRIPGLIRDTAGDSGITADSLRTKGNALIKKAGAYILRLSADRIQND